VAGAEAGTTMNVIISPRHPDVGPGEQPADSRRSGSANTARPSAWPMVQESYPPHGRPLAV